MEYIKQFIEDAIDGGWFKDKETMRKENIVIGHYGIVWCDADLHKSNGDILLDPTAWQAVGKTRGWDDLRGIDIELDYSSWMECTETEVNQMQFTHHLQRGKTIEEALKEII